MPDVADIEVFGLQALLAKLNYKRYQVAFRVTLHNAGRLIKGVVAEYPPKSEANMPRAHNTVMSIRTGRYVNQWYVRGVGIRTTTGRTYRVSEDLGGRWEVNVEGLTVEVGNPVSYGPYVQGSKQAGFHKARGWKTIWQGAKEAAPKIRTMIASVITRILNS